MADILTPVTDGTNLGEVLLGYLVTRGRLVDTLGNDILGALDASPNALTMLGRLKSINDNVAALAPLLDGVETGLATLATQATLAEVSGKLPSTIGQKAAGNSLSVVLATGSDAATGTGQAAMTTAIATIGTRAYGAGLTPIAVTTAGAASAAVTGTEVTLCNVGANRCHVRAGTAATVNDLAIEAGQDRTIRITTGQTINAITPTGTTTLNVVPVA